MRQDKNRRLAYSVERIAYSIKSFFLSAIRYPLSLPCRRAGAIRYALYAKSCSFAFFLVAFVLICFAKDINYEISVDANKASLGQAIQLNIVFKDVQSMPALELPAIEAFQARYVGPSTSMSIVNGAMSSSITHVYTLLPTKVGTFEIGPFKFTHNGDNYISNSFSVEVAASSGQSDAQSSQSGQEEPKDLKDRIFLTMQPKKNTIYLNEIVPVSIKLFVNKLKVGLPPNTYPSFGHDGFSVGEFEQPRQYQDVVGGVSYDIIEFPTTIYGLKPGEYRLGPATMTCGIMVKKQARRQSSVFPDEFFDDIVGGGYETYPMDLKSADVPITVSQLPDENKPEGFLGALGVFDLEVTVGPQEVRVGDPLTVKSVVRGTGNLNTVNLQITPFAADFKSYEPQVKQEKEAKVFEQVLIPLKADAREIPVINFSFFNPDKARYETIVRGPFPIKIIKPEKEEEPRVVENDQAKVNAHKEESLGRDIVYIKDKPGKLRRKGAYLYRSKFFWGVQVIPLLGYLGLLIFLARSRRLKTDIKYARQLLAPRKAKEGIRKARGFLEQNSVGAFYDILFLTLQEYLGDEFQLPSKGITISVFDEQLKNIILPEEIMSRMQDIFRECDMARYATSQLTQEDMRISLQKLEEVIDYFQRNKI